MIGEFKGEYAFLSNFWEEVDGSTVEHEYQAFKASYSGDILYVLSAATAGQAKRWGRAVECIPGWEEQKYHVMLFFVAKKFLDHEDLREKLLATGERELIEGNHWHDNFWGRCSCAPCQERGTSLNHLGAILMDIRTKLRSF